MPELGINSGHEKNSLLHKLREKEIQQIFTDHALYYTVNYTFFIDADDILSYIDPYGLIYNKNGSKEIDDLADNFYAINSLLEHKRGKVYLFNEYSEELDLHKKKFNEIFVKSENFIEVLSEKNKLISTSEIRSYISKFFSEIYFILKRRGKSFYDIYEDIFYDEKVKENHKLEESYFDNEEIFLEEEHRERIELIYDLFPKKAKGYSSLVDAICIYKIFLLNQISPQRTRYIYFSSANKSKNIFNKISTKINNSEWSWLKEIMKDNPEEKLFFYRNNKYNFGYIIYRILSKKIGSSNNAKSVFKDYCKKKSEDSIIIDLLNEKREYLENLSIFTDCKLSSEELKYSTKNEKNIDHLLSEIENLKELTEIKKIDFIKEIIFTTGLVQELYAYLKGHDLKIDRGLDNIISLFNTLPPLFALNEYILVENKYKKFQDEVEDFIAYASFSTEDKNRISVSTVLSFLNTYRDNGEKKEFNLSEISNLLIIFLLILIKYTSDEGEDSNFLAYKYCDSYERQIRRRIDTYKLKENEYTLEIKESEFLLRELAVLKVWSLRRRGQYYSSMVLKFSDKIHADLIAKYPNDFRFKLSSFLSRVNYLYYYKDFHKSNLNRVNIYVEEAIQMGEDAKKEITKLKKFENHFYLIYSYKTIINSLGFIYCIRLDLLLYQNIEQYGFSKKSMFLYRKIKDYKDLRKELRSNINEQSYREKEVYQPVFSYVEAYIEYLEAHIIDEEEIEEKIGHAKKSINRALKNLKKDKKDRPFFYSCCEKLKVLIERKEKNLTNMFESFILNVSINK